MSFTPEQQRSYRAARVARGVCVRCPEPVAPGKSQCVDCCNRSRTRAARERVDAAAGRAPSQGWSLARVRKIATMPGAIASFDFSHGGAR